MMDPSLQLLIEVKGQVDEMHGVVYRDGLVQSVKDQGVAINDLRDALSEFLATRYGSCPYKIAVDERATQRRHKFDSRLLIYGTIIGVLSALPDIIEWIITL